METSTEFVSKSRKMRVSFLVLVSVIAVCNTNASAKAVKFVAEDETNSVSQSSIEQDPKNGSICETTVNKTNGLDGEHILNKREISSDLGKKLSTLSKQMDRKKKTESKKSKYEEHRKKTVSNVTHSAKKDKYESQKDKYRQGRLAVGNWYVPQIRPKSFSFPVIYSAPGGYNAWPMQTNIQANPGKKEYEAKALPPKDMLRVGELVEVFHSSFKKGLESLFDTLGKELKKKLGHTSESNEFAVPSGNARSSCIDTGDGSCESESADGTYDAISPNDCSDTPTPTNDSNGIASNDMSKTSDSPLEFLKETLPVIVQAAETILSESIENKRSAVGGFGNNGVVADDEIDDRRSSAWDLGDEAAEPVPGDGMYNGKAIPWDFGDFDADRAPVGFFEGLTKTYTSLTTLEGPPPRPRFRIKVGLKVTDGLYTDNYELITIRAATKSIPDSALTTWQRLWESSATGRVTFQFLPSATHGGSRKKKMGVEIQTVVPGDGQTFPKRGQTVVVHYTGILEDGSKFDSSWDRGVPFKFRLGKGEVLKGWDQGVARMSVGERANLKCPPELAYGSLGHPGVIPPNAVLFFDIAILRLEP